MAEKDELKMAEERLRLRHGGSSKWGKEMRRFKSKMDNKDIREQYNQMMRDKNMLKDRQTKVRGAQGSDEDESGSESDSDRSEGSVKK